MPVPNWAIPTTIKYWILGKQCANWIIFEVIGNLMPNIEREPIWTIFFFLTLSINFYFRKHALQVCPYCPISICSCVSSSKQCSLLPIMSFSLFTMIILMTSGPVTYLEIREREGGRGGNHRALVHGSRSLLHSIGDSGGRGHITSPKVHNSEGSQVRKK